MQSKFSSRSPSVRSDATTHALRHINSCHNTASFLLNWTSVIIWPCFHSTDRPVKKIFVYWTTVSTMRLKCCLSDMCLNSKTGGRLSLNATSRLFMNDGYIWTGLALVFDKAKSNSAMVRTQFFSPVLTVEAVRSTILLKIRYRRVISCRWAWFLLNYGWT